MFEEYAKVDSTMRYQLSNEMVFDVKHRVDENWSDVASDGSIIAVKTAQNESNFARILQKEI
jgi:hypothetical protein